MYFPSVLQEEGSYGTLQVPYSTVMYRTVPYHTVTVLVPYYTRIGTDTVQFEYNIVLPYGGFPLILAQILAISAGGG
jgi:hypothetical protein